MPKKEVVKKEEKKTKKKALPKEVEYFSAVGRRKSAVARVRLFNSDKNEFSVNEKKMEEYFTTLELREKCSSALKKMKCFDSFKITVKVVGGGINAQAEAIRHGISRALCSFNPEFKKRLRKVGYLTRDPRQRERKKFGLKRARRAPQWKKR
jgi:small subunit ribosomal protein S9